jgi:putative sterol carrier protein
MPTVKELFENMPSTFQRDAAKGMSVVYQFDITGDGGGKWYAAIDDGELSVVEGEHDRPNATITMVAGDYIAMSTGKLSGQAAFMSGKLKVKGDMFMAMKMANIFKR